MRAKLLGSFAISYEGRDAGPWPRPTAKRLCELVLASPNKHISRDFACETLFPRHGRPMPLERSSRPCPWPRACWQTWADRRRA